MVKFLHLHVFSQRIASNSHLIGVMLDVLGEGKEDQEVCRRQADDLAQRSKDVG